MDILAGMLVYLAGIGALFAGLALSFFVFFSTPHEPATAATKRKRDVGAAEHAE